MCDPGQPFSKSFVLVLGILIGVAAGQDALAASEELAAIHDEAIATDAALSTAAGLSGVQVYNTVCIACHSPPGVGGAPALGNSEAWAARIAQGMDALINHALNGFSGSTGVMPKKGQRLDLSDEEVIRAVHYMVEQIAR